MAADKALMDLLKEWNVLIMFERLQDEGIGIEELRIMKEHHLQELLEHYKMGVRIRFEHHYDCWRKQHVVHEEDKTAIEQITTTNATNKLDNALEQSQIEKEFCSPASSPTANLCIRTSKAATKRPMYDKKSDDRTACPTLLDILNTSCQHGKILMELYKKKKPLNHQHRCMLIGVIVNYFDVHDLHLSMPRSYELEQQILDLFPGEKLENFRTEKRGKIYIKYGNMKRYKRCRIRKKLDSDATISNNIDSDNMDTNAETTNGETTDLETDAPLHFIKNEPIEL